VGSASQQMANYFQTGRGLVTWTI